MNKEHYRKEIIEKKTYNQGYISRFTTSSLQDNIIRKDDISDENRLSSPNDIQTYGFKIVFIGDISVGKSSIIKRYIDNTFSNEYECTVGTELSKKSIIIGKSKKINLEIWDTCGQEKFRSVTRQYYRNSQAIIIVFDLTNLKTFNNLDSWMRDILNYSAENSIFFLLGNKKDKEKLGERKVEQRQIKNFVKNNLKIKKYMEISAKTGEGIELAFDKIIHHLIINFEREIKNNEKNELYKIDLGINNRGNEKESKCC